MSDQARPPSPAPPAALARALGSLPAQRTAAALLRGRVASFSSVLARSLAPLDPPSRLWSWAAGTGSTSGPSPASFGRLSTWGTGSAPRSAWPGALAGRADGRLAGAPWAVPGVVPYAALITRSAREAGVDPALVAAVAHVESSFNPRAVSSAGAKGLMQLMDATARGLGVADPFDPAQSLAGGARLLGRLLREFGGDPRLALAAYNAGPAAVRRFGGIPPYEGTRGYVPKVLQLYEQYRRRWSATTPDQETA